MTKLSHSDQWEAVIGLEVHVQLDTKSKLFSDAPARFGDEPNMNITEVCTGQPGALPVLNEEAVRKAVLFGLAINSKISLISGFDRKSYFYPDSPRNFQITQFDHPILQGGRVVADVAGETKIFEIKEAHIEDDAGMLKHFTNFTGIDYNRAGVPLLEIVSHPTMHTAKEAVAYVMSIKATMEYLEASDCNMEEGSLRVDANVSVRPKGSKELRNKIEIKNMNSFSMMEMAIDSEIDRQIKLYITHPDEDFFKLIEPATFRFDPEKKQTVLMRKKESYDDYRYFPEPDLPPIILTQAKLAEWQKFLPELPHERYQRYIKDLKLTPYSAAILINDKKLGDYFEKACTHSNNPGAVSNWITIEFAGRLKEKNETLFSLKIPPEHIGKLVSLIDKQVITGKIAKMVADDMVLYPDLDPEVIVKKNPDYQPLQDSMLIESVIDKVLKEQPESVSDFKQGKTKAFGFLVGQVMQHTKGKAPPNIVNELLKKKLSE